MTKSGELSRRWYSLRPSSLTCWRTEAVAALLFGFGRGIAYESRERNLRVDDDVFLLGQVQHDVGAQVVSLGVLDVVLRFVVDALDER